jgi:hypothetical protein
MRRDLLMHVITASGTSAWIDTLHRLAEARQIVCADWGGLGDRMQLLVLANQELVTKGGTPISPFLAMGLPLSPEIILSITQAHALRAVTSAERERRGARGDAAQSGTSVEGGQALAFSPFPWGPERVPLQFNIVSGLPRRLRVVYLAAHFDKDKLMNGFLRDFWHRFFSPPHLSFCCLLVASSSSGCAPARRCVCVFVVYVLCVCARACV